MKNKLKLSFEDKRELELINKYSVQDFGVFIFKKTHTENNMDDKQSVSTEETEEVLEDVEFPHAAELDQASEITDDGEQILYLPKEEELQKEMNKQFPKYKTRMYKYLKRILI